MVDVEHVVLRRRAASLGRLKRIARRLAGVLKPGDLVLLYVPLGSGKTTFVRSVAEALDVSAPVRSPSFILANIYAGKMTLHHLDLYRLDEIGEEDALALEEYLRGDVVTLVEWPEAGAGRLGSPTWTITIGHESPGKRSVEIRAMADEARKRWDEGRGRD